MSYSTCPICDAPVGESFFSIASAPALCHRLCHTRAEAQEQPRGPVELTLCTGCGLVFNRAFDAGRIRYDGEYENALHFSGVFREYAENLAQYLVSEHGIAGKTVAEIGCGDGQFLASLCAAGARDALGFDPAFDAARHEVAGENVRIVPELFDAEALRDTDIALICCRQVLEHIEQPRSFMGGLRNALGSHAIPVFFEVPSAIHSLKRRGFWDIIYEHVTYFTPEAIRVLFERSGFDVSKTQEVYSGQFLTVESRSGAGNADATPSPGEIEALEDCATRFGDDYRALQDEWRERLKTYEREGTVCALWGAGSKTVMFLNNLDVSTDAIGHVVDRNPRKHNCYIVGTGQEIIAPERLPEIDPQVVILMNAAYRDEVAADLAKLGCNARLEIVR